MTKLTDKQELFCKEYIVDLNGAQAAIRCGYSEKTAKEQASRLLTNVNVQERVTELQEERSKRVEIDADYVLTSLKSVAERCMQAEPVMIRDGDEMIESGEYKFEHSGANRALELLGKNLKLFTDKTEISGELSVLSEILSEIEETDGLPKAED